MCHAYTIRCDHHSDCMKCCYCIQSTCIYAGSRMHTTIMIQLMLLCALSGLVPSHAIFVTSGVYCWTKWLDRDNPGGTGDWEHLSAFNPSTVCPRPVGIDCETTSGTPYDQTGMLHWYTMTASHLLRVYAILYLS